MILIALGANLPSQYGSPLETLKKAKDVIAARGIDVIASSRVWQTAPVPLDPDQPEYCNAVISVETDLPPQELLNLLLEIEQEFGRERGAKNAARVLDLDVIAYHDEIVDTQYLTLPHPRMHERGFVLLPLQDITADWGHPAHNKTLDDLIEALPEDQDAKPLEEYL